MMQALLIPCSYASRSECVSWIKIDIQILRRNNWLHLTFFSKSNFKRQQRTLKRKQVQNIATFVENKVKMKDAEDGR